MLTAFNKREAAGLGLLLFVSVFFALPIVAMIVYLPDMHVLWSIITEPYTIEILRFSMLQALASTLISLLIGMLLARALHRRQFFFKQSYFLVTSLPIVMPVVLVSASFVFIYGASGWFDNALSSLGLSLRFSALGFWPIVAVHVFFNAPLAMRVFYQSLENMPQNYWRLAQTFGWKSLALFRFIEWPAFRKHIVTLAMLSFLLCFTAFSSVLLLSSNPLQATLEVAIFQSLKYDQDFTRIAVYGFLQLLICAGIYACVYRFQPSDFSVPASEKIIKRGDEGNSLAKFFDVLLLLMFGLFCGLPVVSILLNGFNWQAWSVLQNEAFYRAMFTTLKIALGASLLATLMGYLMAYLQNQIQYKQEGNSSFKPSASSHLWLLLLNVIPKLNLVLPAMMFIAAIFLLYGSTLIPGSFYLLLMLNALWMVPFVIRLVLTQLVKVSYYHKLSQSLAVSNFSHWRYVEWPIIRKALFFSIAIAMAFSIGDFGIIAVINHEQLLTLPMYMYQLMGSYQMAQAKVVALVILMLIVSTFILLYAMEKIMSKNSKR